ncbi:MAG: hypothetical protein ACLVH3_10150 [Blautia obeum]
METEICDSQQEPSGKYFASLLFCCENQTAEKDRQKNLLGSILRCRECVCFLPVKELNIRCSIGIQRKKLAREQRKLSRCQKGSQNYKKQKKRVALCHEKIEIREKTFSINSVPVLLRASMQYAWKI